MATVMSPGGNEVSISPEEQAQIDLAKQRKQDLVKQLVQELSTRREECVRAKRQIEKRWIDDIRQIDGENRLINTKEFPSQNNDDNARPPTPHLTRSRCDLWESRMVDLLAPTSDPTWDLKPLIDSMLTPQLLEQTMQMLQQQHMQQFQQAQQQAQQAQQQGQQPPQPPPPPTQDDAIEFLEDQAYISSVKMRNVIRAQLASCNSQQVVRKMCHDATRVGTGLIIGPMSAMRTEHKFDQQQMQTTVTGTTIPEVRMGDPWCFYPDMVESAEKAEFAFYVHFMSELDLWRFCDQPGVDKEEIKALMTEKPSYGSIEESIRERNQYSGFIEDIRNRHAVWRYTGIIPYEYKEALDLPGLEEGPLSADIWFSNDHILCAKITALAAVKDYRIPYFVFAPFPIDDTMFGASIPYMCRDSQRMATSAMWIMLHNASVSAGPQIFMRRSKIRPLDQKWSLRGPKLWDVLDPDANLNDVFAAVNIENNVQQAIGIYELAKQLMDEELSTQQWASQDTAEETSTASGLAMLMNARTILQRRVCAAADDEIFRPMIQRFVLWNLLYSPRQDIKGDYDVLPLCQSVRLVKDIQIQQKLFIATQIAPLNQGMFDQYGMIQDIVRSLDVQIDNWLVPREKYEASQETMQQHQQSIQDQMQALQAEFLVAKTQHEKAKAGLAFNKGQAELADQAQQPADGQVPGIDPERWLQHQEFLIDQQVKLHLNHGNLLMSQGDNQTKQVLAAMKTQSDNQRDASAQDADIRRTRTELFKHGASTRMKQHELAVKQKIATMPRPMPTGKFTTPRVPRYTGGKRPAT